MSKIELPPLPRPIYAASCGKDPFYTADHIRADRRQIVELCAALADALSDEVELIPPSNKFARGRMQGMWDCAAAIRSLLDEKKGNE